MIARRRPGHADRRGRPRRATSSRVGGFLYEPDGAVIRAGLVTAVAAGVGGGLLDEHIAYVTSDESFRTPFARGYGSSRTLPYREKQLRAALRERGVGRLTIKKRGVDVVPEQLRKRLALRGDEEATIVLTRVAGSGAACWSPVLRRRRSESRSADTGRRRAVGLSTRVDRPGQPQRAFSAPIVVSSPCPVCTTVSSGSAKSFARIESSMRSAGPSTTGRSRRDHPGTACRR